DRDASGPIDEVVAFVDGGQTAIEQVAVLVVSRDRSVRRLRNRTAGGVAADLIELVLAPARAGGNEDRPGSRLTDIAVHDELRGVLGDFRVEPHRIVDPVACFLALLSETEGIDRNAAVIRLDQRRAANDLARDGMPD